MSNNLAESLYCEGRLAFDDLRYSEAVSLFIASISHHAHYKAYELLGASLKALDQTAEALAALERAYELNSGSSKTACILATYLLDEGSTDQCREIMNSVLAVKPTYGPARKLLEDHFFK